MRTTLTVDSDLLEKARKAAAKQHRPIKVVINEALRLGLTQLQNNPPEKYVLKARKLIRHPGLNGANISELLEHAEGERYK
jgi:hypothetical protein